MKKLLLISLAILLLAGAGAAVSRHHKNYQNKQTQDAVTAAVAAANTKKDGEISDIKTSAAAEYDALRIECEKGIAAYGKLTPALQKTTPLPVCGTAAKH